MVKPVYYVTKYALSAGIQKVTGKLIAAGTILDYTTDKDHWCKQYAHGEGKDFHLTLESAKERAREMRAKKIASLEKSLNKMRNYEPEVVNCI